MDLARRAPFSISAQPAATSRCGNGALPVVCVSDAVGAIDRGDSRLPFAVAVAPPYIYTSMNLTRLFLPSRTTTRLLCSSSSQASKLSFFSKTYLVRPLYSLGVASHRHRDAPDEVTIEQNVTHATFTIKPRMFTYTRTTPFDPKRPKCSETSEAGRVNCVQVNKPRQFQTSVGANSAISFRHQTSCDSLSPYPCIYYKHMSFYLLL
jgi:hypothetical protein